MWSLPRAERALQAWRKAALGVQGLPMPWVVTCAIIGHLLPLKKVQEAMHVLINFRTYLRPGYLDAITVGQVVPPNPAAGSQYRMWGLLMHPATEMVPGKAGLMDQAILLDTGVWLDPFLPTLTKGRDMHTPL